MFEQHPSLTYRISQLEIAQAAERAERARVIAENADRLRPHRGLLTRLRDAWARRRASRGPAASSAAARSVSTAAHPAPAPAPAPALALSPTAATSCAASPRLAPGRSAASRPAPVASRAAASRSV